MKKETCQINSLNNLLILAKKILNHLNNTRLITLQGNLGSGKTTFAQQIGKILKIKEKIVSPSFVLFKIYALPKKFRGIKYLCHADFYRIQKSSFVNLNEYLSNPEVLTIVEWPENIVLPKVAKLKMQFIILNEKTRKIVITRDGETRKQ